MATCCQNKSQAAFIINILPILSAMNHLEKDTSLRDRMKKAILTYTSYVTRFIFKISMFKYDMGWQKMCAVKAYNS
jgi:hypothetical protein